MSAAATCDAPRELVLPPRRCSHTVTWKAQIGSAEHLITVSFGLIADPDDGRRVMVAEVFCRTGKEGSDFRAAITDGCIALSRAIRHGDSIGGLAAAFGEDRGEGEKSGPPSSYLGAIAKKGAEIEAWVNHSGEHPDGCFAAREQSA